MNPLTAVYTLPSGNFFVDFHTFAIEWEENVVRFYVDDHLYETRTPTDSAHAEVGLRTSPLSAIEPRRRRRPLPHEPRQFDDLPADPARRLRTRVLARAGQVGGIVRRTMGTVWQPKRMSTFPFTSALKLVQVAGQISILVGAPPLNGSAS